MTDENTTPVTNPTDTPVVEGTEEETTTPATPEAPVTPEVPTEGEPEQPESTV